MNHDDVLECCLPRDEGGRVDVLEIVKGRAKGAFQMRDVSSAERLYSRAIELCEVNIAGKRITEGKHLLYSNRAAVRLLRGKHEPALRDTDRCMQLDPTFIKAHFRKAQALVGLERFEDAISACDTGLILQPGNKELEELKTQADTNLQKQKTDQETQKERDVYRPVAPAKTKKENGPENEGDPAAGGEKMEEDAAMRGYKKTADGKTTSYFHTELDEVAKKLIGDCKPQKIDTPASDGGGTQVGSAWNQAGTFEERNFTTWFTERVTADVSGALLLENDVKLLYYVKKTTGEAHIACARGRLRYIHDVKVLIRWKFQLGAEQVWVKGTVEFDPDASGGWETAVEVENPTAVPAEGRKLIEAHVKKKGGPPLLSLQATVLDNLQKVEAKWREIK